VDSGRLTQQEIDGHCRRVLALKQWAGLNRYRPIKLPNLYEDLNAPHAQYLSHRLTELSITLLRNQKSLLPLQRLDTLRVATLVLGSTSPDTTDFQRAVADYAPTAHFRAAATPTLDELAQLRTALKPYNLVLVSLQNLGRLPATSFGITPETNLLLRELVTQKQTLVLSVFGSAYAVAKVRDLDRAAAVVLAYQESPNAQSLAAQAIFGGIGASGRLPVTVSDRYPRGFGLRTAPGFRLRYANPEDVNMDPRLEARVDSLVGRALAAQAFPGGQVLIARRGTVVLRKSYGNQTYAGEGIGDKEKGIGKKNVSPIPSSLFLTVPRPVRNDDLYDLASMTKLMAATPALLKLQGVGKFSPDSTMGNYFGFLRGTNKADLKMRDVLTHQARLKAWIPFWQELRKKNGDMRRRYFRADSSARFPLPVAAGLWARKDLPARIYKEIGESPLNEKPGYVYSDLSFILYPELVKARTGQTFDTYLQQQVYRPLGATTLGFRPTNRFPLRRIVPTEVDSAFRRQLLHGTVHDEGAALLGGLSGHAGLFGDANDVAKLAQTYAWGGRYGGQQLFDKATMDEWTRCQFCPDNRRALAFDRPAANPTVNSAKSASQRSYGHTGFTGTYFWVEPEKDLVVILLTNRVHPTRRNNKLGDLSVRSSLLQLAIEAAR
jgi:CubicO group peptidase (beta-lactamase class C family)